MQTLSCLWVSTVVTLCLALAAPAGAQGPPPPSDTAQYRLTTLDLPNAAEQLGQVFLTDLNENVPPQITIAFDFLAHRVRQPSLIYTRDDQITTVHCDAQTLWTSIQGVNRHKDAAGWCYHEDAQGTGSVGAFYRSASGAVTRIAVPGAAWSEAHDVNNFKRVTGAWGYGTEDCHGFLWDAVTRRLTTFDAPFPGAVCTVPLVMDNAEVIGGLYHQPLGAVHGFLYDFRRNRWTAVEPDGAEISAVTGLNDFGTAVVWSQTLAAGTTIATYHAPTGAFAVLPWPLPAFGQEARGFSSINNQGKLLGFHEMTTVPNEGEEFGVGFTRGVIATPLPPAPAALVAGRNVASQRQAQVSLAADGTQPAMVLGGCPGDGVARPGKLAMVWAGCQ